MLVLMSLAIYSQLQQAPFTVYDDYRYVLENPYVNSGLSWAGVKWAFGGHEANWHPLTWMSHMLDVRCFGLDAGKHHLVNLLFHSVNSLLLFGLLRNLTGAFWRSAVVAALFAWHPMHVESVAWIAERKDVLSTFFWLLTIFAYAGYCRGRRIFPVSFQKPAGETGSGTSNQLYLLVVLLFALSLMAKPMVVTLPFLLLLLDFWPLQRRKPWRLLVIEKLPLLAMSAISCVITVKVQAADHAVTEIVPLSMRITTAVNAYAHYLAKLFWPTRLAVFYPYNPHPPVGETAGAIIVLAVISGLVLYYWRSKPFLFVGWCWFLGTLVPTIGLVQVGRQSMADRYTYVPAIGLFIAVVWLGAEIVANHPVLRPVAVGAALLGLLSCSFAAQRQAGYWRSDELLFNHALEVTTNNDVAEYDLAYSFQVRKNYPEAVVHYQKSLALDPGQNNTECDLALCLAKLGRQQEAIEHYKKSLKLNDRVWAVHQDYGLSLAAIGDAEGALAEYREAIRLAPGAIPVHLTLAGFFLAHNRNSEARQEFETILRLDPGNYIAHQQIAAIFNSLGQKAEAINEYKTALKLNPDDVVSLNDLAWIRAASADPSLRNGAEAVQLATHACELTGYAEPLLIGTLADAYAQAGRFQDAEAAAVRARDLAAARNLTNVAIMNEQLLQLYSARQVYHEPAITK